MTARDWANFGAYIMQEKRPKPALVTFHRRLNAVETGKRTIQNMVIVLGVSVNGRPTLTLQGHGSQFMVLDEKNDTIC